MEVNYKIIKYKENDVTHFTVAQKVTFLWFFKRWVSYKEHITFKTKEIAVEWVMRRYQNHVHTRLDK